MTVLLASVVIVVFGFLGAAKVAAVQLVDRDRPVRVILPLLVGGVVAAYLLRVV